MEFPHLPPKFTIYLYKHILSHPVSHPFPTQKNAPGWWQWGILCGMICVENVTQTEIRRRQNALSWNVEAPFLRYLY